MSLSRSLCVAMPAYNEADVIEGFLHRLDKELSAYDGDVHFVVVNDASTDDTAQVVQNMAEQVEGRVHLFHNAVNLGHGPTTSRAFEEALRLEPSEVLQLDADGQMEPSDFWLLEGGLRSGADIAVGVRLHRTDPWFRKTLSRTLRWYLKLRFGLYVADPNCPVRLYRAEVLRALLRDLPPQPLVPSIYLSILAARARVTVTALPIQAQARPGVSEQGSTWGSKERRFLIPRRLISFVVEALRQLRRFEKNLAPKR